VDGRAARRRSPSSPSQQAPRPPLEDLPVSGRDPYDESEDRLFVSSCLDTLDERDRRILELRFYGELSQREIARELGISQIHVSRLIERSLRTLQRRAEWGPVSSIVLPAPNSYTQSRGASGQARRRAQARI
jgi:RNA polymerase sigma-B factor